MDLYQLTVTCVIFHIFYCVSRSSNICYIFKCSYVLLLSYILIFPQPGLPLGLLLFAYNFVNSAESVRDTAPTPPHIPPKRPTHHANSEGTFQMPIRKPRARARAGPGPGPQPGPDPGRARARVRARTPGPARANTLANP